jgi:hypothetical protein
MVIGEAAVAEELLSFVTGQTKNSQRMRHWVLASKAIFVVSRHMTFVGCPGQI